MLSDTVKIVSSPEGPRCFLASGEQLQGVSRIAWSVAVDTIAVAEITLFSEDVEVQGVPQVAMRHPITGNVQLVDYISFEDGTSWAPPSANQTVGDHRYLSPLVRLPRDQIRIEALNATQLGAALYTRDGSLYWQKVRLSDLPNDLIGIEDLERHGVLSVYVAAVEQLIGSRPVEVLTDA